jgi:hypothetical protein
MLFSRALAPALSSAFFVALSLSACAADLNAGGDDDGDALAQAQTAGGPNLCIGQAANTFQCIDDTRFQHCIGGDQFAEGSCPANLCATRTPSSGNPCIGRDRAREIDGVEPPTPGQASPPPADNGGGDIDQGGGDQGGGDVDNGGGDVDNGGGDVGNGGGNDNGGGDDGEVCVGGPRFDPAGVPNVGNGQGRQFIGGQCLSAADCASGCCALPCGICSGPGAQFQAGKQGCGFGD